MKNQETDRYGR